MFQERPVSAFVGPYGSGKTEVAINYAIRRRARGGRVAIIDLDVVTPYFRTREVREDLERMGLRVVAPTGPMSVSELPVIPAEARGVLEDESIAAVVDVGGDPAGSRAFGSLAGYVRPGRLNVLFVVNTNRPFTRTADAVVGYVREIEAAAGKACTGLVSNTHLGRLTTARMILAGRETALRAGETLDVPVVLVCAPEGLDLPSIREEVLPLRLFMKPPWEGRVDDLGGL